MTSITDVSGTPDETEKEVGHCRIYALDRDGRILTGSVTDADPAFARLLLIPAPSGGLPDEPDGNCREAPRDYLLGWAEDDLGPSWGILLGICLSLPLWAAIAGAAYFVSCHL